MKDRAFAEAFDASVADMLTRMMGSSVLLLPELAQAPGSTLANVYVFTNGVSERGYSRRR